MEIFVVSSSSPKLKLSTGPCIATTIRVMHSCMIQALSIESHLAEMQFCHDSTVDRILFYTG